MRLTTGQTHSQRLAWVVATRVRLFLQPWSDSAEKPAAEVEFEEVEFDRIAIKLHYPERMLTFSKRDFKRILRFLTDEKEE